MGEWGSPPTGLDGYLRSIRRFPLLTASGEIRLARGTRRGERGAWHGLVQGNLRLVVRIARDFQGYGLSMEDLVAEGNLGLMEAARRFDPGRGVRFVTYAACWIRKYVLAALKRHRAHTLAPVAVTAAGRLRAGEARASAGPPRRRILSLDDDTASYGEPAGTRVASGDPGPDERLTAREVIEGLREVLDCLSARQRAILEAHYGLRGERRQSLREIAASMGCTREWVRQLERRALGRARRLLEIRSIRA